MSRRLDGDNESAIERAIERDVELLRSLGYRQELLRRLGRFSNFAISLSIICILAGCITSFHLGYSAAGGGGVALGWPVACLFSLAVAASMGQIASAFPTAGGLYHWASILGGRGWGWATAWFNLAGLITVLAAINVGTYEFVLGSLKAIGGIETGPLSDAQRAALQAAGVGAIAFSQALVNHLGIRWTARLTDFSGYLIFAVAAALIAALFYFSPSWDLSRLVTLTNYSGPRGGDVWPQASSVAWLFALGLLLPAYTVTGFDASAHVSEETVGAERNVPRGMVHAVLVSGISGWLLVGAIVLSLPEPDAAAAQGSQVFYWLLRERLPRWLAAVLAIGIAAAQFICGLATVTSASRMTYAFARDGGLPFSMALRRVSDARRSPAAAVWTVAALAVLFTVYAGVYSTITAVSTIFLYLSYVLPIALGALAHGRTWTRMGPWTLGRWYRPLSVVSVLGCAGLLAIGMAPPNDKALWIVGATAAAMTVIWFGAVRRVFEGPPKGLMALGKGGDRPARTSQNSDS